MKILGFEITRASVPQEKRGFYDTIAAWRSSVNFTNVTAPGYGLANPWEAMGVPAVYACVSKIAKTIAACPKQVYDVSEPHNARRIMDSPVARMLATKPNSYQTGYSFWFLTATRQPLWGNFYAEIQRDLKTGEAIGLYPLLNQDVTPELKAGKKIFRVGGRDMADDDIFHVMEPGFISGVSKIAMHRSAIRASVEMQSFTEGFYRNGMKSSGALTHPGELSVEAGERLRSQFAANYQGGDNAGRPMLLEEGVRFEPFSMPLGDAEFVATQRLQIAQIARIFDVPLHKLAEMDGAKFNNIEQQNLAFVIDCIEPIITSYTQEADKLFADRDRGRLELRISTDHLLRGDMQSRLTALATARQWSIMTINEARRSLGLNDIGPAGDEMHVPGNANAAAAPPAAKPAALPAGDQ
jgi:HK97 family phage portal protein